MALEEHLGFHALSKRKVYFLILVGTYARAPTGGTYTMDNAEAADAALAISPQVAIPMHRWDTNPGGIQKQS